VIIGGIAINYDPGQIIAEMMRMTLKSVLNRTIMIIKAIIGGVVINYDPGRIIAGMMTKLLKASSS
jgi:hypothetical protein